MNSRIGLQKTVNLAAVPPSRLITKKQAKLCFSSDGILRQKQAILSKKHKAAQDRIDSLNVGGGISIWPQAANMRLTGKETCTLIFTSTILMFSTAVLFTIIHGKDFLSVDNCYLETIFCI